MKVLLVIALAFAGFAAAQTTTPKAVLLQWTDTTNPAGTTYRGEKAASACGATGLTWSQIFTGLAVKEFRDTAVVIGNTYCYRVYAGNGTLFSAPSNAAPAVIPFNAPTLTIQVEVAVNVKVNGDEVAVAKATVPVQVK